MTSHGGVLVALEASLAGSRCRLRGLWSMVDGEWEVMVQEEARTDVRRSSARPK